MSDYEQEIIDDETKVSIAAEFMRYAPPGEFAEVYNDVAALVNDDAILKRATSEAIGQWNVDQFLPVNLKNDQQQQQYNSGDHDGSKCLLTPSAALDNGRYCDPKSKQTFKYDHIQLVAHDIRQDYAVDNRAESMRRAIEHQVEEYVKTHFPNGTTSIYGSSQSPDCTTEITVCIEDHEFQSRNHWGGRWRSLWTIKISGPKAAITGLLRIQVHYYEDGNVQLLSKKDVKHEMTVQDDSKFASDFVKYVKSAENEYQSAISDNYVKMSDTTFKALRRQLPMTRTKIDWGKLLGYKIGNEVVKAKKDQN
jgi:capping protein alpha